jgi:hypothetical protein
VAANAAKSVIPSLAHSSREYGAIEFRGLPVNFVLFAFPTHFACPVSSGQSFSPFARCDVASRGLASVERASRRDNIVMSLLPAWFLAGLTLDAWAHSNLPNLETFFTPVARRLLQWLHCDRWYGLL